MKTVIFAFGSRGDTQPCVALGAGLRARGHDVTVIASARYKALITQADLTFHEISVDPQSILESDEGRAWLRSGPVGFFKGFREFAEPHAERMVAEIDAACAGTELILSPVFGWMGQHMSERHGAPYALMQFQPGEPTREFANPMVPRWFPARASYAVVEKVAWRLMEGLVNRVRERRLGLPPLPARGPFALARAARVPVLCAFSDAVVPRPRDWASHVHTTGYWFLSTGDRTPPAALAAFLDAGPAPVYVGFGSMVPGPGTMERVRRALRAAGVRGVILGEGPDDDQIRHVRDVPHSWLFPRMAAVVHHGGAGTTGAGLAAGVPNVVCPFFSDQPYWGSRVAALGAGPAPLPVKALTSVRLARAVRLALTERVRDRARALGERLRREDGVSRACELILPR